jgi:tight adherence protein C
MLVGTNRSLIAAEQLAIAAKKENLMLLPLVFLILPITVVFALFPSMQYLNLNQ